MRSLNHSTLKSNSSERISGELLTKSFSYSVLLTYLPIPTEFLLTLSFIYTYSGIYITEKGCAYSDTSFCTSLGIRTLDPLIKSQLLYQLS